MTTLIRQRLRALKFVLAVTSVAACAAQSHTAIPEPGLIMCGAVRNSAGANARLTTGTLNWQILPPTGQPALLSTALSDIGGQYSYLLLVPFETVLDNLTLSPGALKLNTAPTTYYRTNVTLTIGTNTYPVTFTNTSQSSFAFGPADRGKLEQADLLVSVPGVGPSTNPPAFSGIQRFSSGQFQMAVSGTVGQSYTLMTSTDLVTWLPAFVFVCTNSPTVISDPMATNFNRRFYRVGP